MLQVSITFDPFMYLTLPLPIQKKWSHSIFYVPWDNGKPHVKIPIEVNRNASFKEFGTFSVVGWKSIPITYVKFLYCGRLIDND